MTAPDGRRVRMTGASRQRLDGGHCINHEARDARHVTLGTGQEASDDGPGWTARQDDGRVQIKTGWRALH
uniref:Uncharacterized protein n=1 Tax=Tanacetum cinerariifolium TaxID=118510 RepID=A0A699QP69_TANCI|nr:hypothetical protein [Tanacetum cinerariifolium]